MLLERDDWNQRWNAPVLLAMLVLSWQPTSAADSGKAAIAATAVPRSSSPARDSLQGDPANSMRIYRPPGGFKHPVEKDTGEDGPESVAPPPQPDSRAPVFFADRVWSDPVDPASLPVEPGSPAFAQVLDGFSERWQHRLGTPVTCAMVLCQGSCASSDAACELAGSWRGESTGCATMPAMGSCGADDRCSAAQEACTDTYDCCAQPDQACAARSAGSTKGDHVSAGHGCAMGDQAGSRSGDPCSTKQ